MNLNQFRNITLQQLEALINLVEERSFSKAAKKMLLTQPSLSKHIKNLEIFADTPVINRTANGVTLTEEGRIIYNMAKKIIKLRDEARDKIRLSRDEISGHIFVGASTIPATYILPTVLTSLKARHPDLHIHLKTSDSDEVIEMVLDDEVELGFIGKQTHIKRLACEPLWDDRLILVVPRGHAWDGREALSFEELAEAPFVSREPGSATLSVLEDHLERHHLVHLRRFAIAAEVGSSEAVKEAVIAGLGVSVLSIHAVRRELAQGLLVHVPLEGEEIRRRFYLITKQHFLPASHHQAFLEHLRTFRIEP